MKPWDAKHKLSIWSVCLRKWVLLPSSLLLKTARDGNPTDSPSNVFGFLVPSSILLAAVLGRYFWCEPLGTRRVGCSFLSAVVSDVFAELSTVTAFHRQPNHHDYEIAIKLFFWMSLACFSPHSMPRLGFGMYSSWPGTNLYFGRFG